MSSLSTVWILLKPALEHYINVPEGACEQKKNVRAISMERHHRWWQAAP